LPAFHFRLRLTLAVNFLRKANPEMFHFVFLAVEYVLI
jgi:hypothetical protein